MARAGIMKMTKSLPLFTTQTMKQNESVPVAVFTSRRWKRGVAWNNNHEKTKTTAEGIKFNNLAGDKEKEEYDDCSGGGGGGIGYSCSWVPHPRSGIYFPEGHESVVDDIPTHAASFDQTCWFRNIDGVDKPDPDNYHHSNSD